MYHRPKEIECLAAFGGIPEICYPSYKTINNDLGLTDASIKKYNDILVKLKLIFIDNAGFWYYKNDSIIHAKESPNIYSLWCGAEDLTKHNLKEGIKYYKELPSNSNKIFTGNREYANNNRQLNGELGSIVQKENKGTATDKDLQRKEELLKALNPNEELYKLNAMLDKDNMTLSDIYDNTGDIDKYNKYFDMEFDLGLIDDSGELRVEFSYYKWVLTNFLYGDKEHVGDYKYYLNSVNATINKNNKTTIKHKGLQDKRNIKNDDIDDWMK